jgi:hypothetical protein
MPVTIRRVPGSEGAITGGMGVVEAIVATIQSREIVPEKCAV